MLQTSPKASATAVPAIFPPALKSTQVCFRMNIERGERLVFFGVIHLIEFTFCVRTLFDVLAVIFFQTLVFLNLVFVQVPQFLTAVAWGNQRPLIRPHLLQALAGMTTRAY